MARLKAYWFKINSNEATGVIIVGCNPLGCLIARLFQDTGESVVLIDTDKKACQKAKAENLKVILSSGLDHKVLEQVGIESMGTFLALTNNGEVNKVLAQRVREEWAPPHVLAVFPHNSSNQTKVNQTKVNQAFMSQVPIKTWNQYLNDKQVKLGRVMVKEAEFSFQKARLQALVDSGELLPLLVKRKNRLQVVNAAQEWLAKDEIIYLLHDSLAWLA